MADAIPAADAGLLAAQAQSGLAGVEAYKQAQATLQQQRQGAVQTAMQEAALRGAPAGAAESQQSIITSPYDQRLASLAQGQAGFTADMAARDRRMADYNSATLKARELIPGEVEKVVAPIRAQGEANIANTTRQGEMAVSEIDANTRLALAMWAAGLAAARRAAAAKAAEKKKLTDSEMKAMLAQGVLAKMTGSLGDLGAMMAENRSKTDINSNVVKGVNAADQALIAENKRQQGSVPMDRSGMFGNNAFLKMMGMGEAPQAALSGAMKGQYNRDVTSWYGNQQTAQATNRNKVQAFIPRPGSAAVVPATTRTVGAAQKPPPNFPAYGNSGQIYDPLTGQLYTPDMTSAMDVLPSGAIPPERLFGGAAGGVAGARSPGAGKVMGPTVSGRDYLSSARQAAELALGRQRDDSKLAPLINAQTGAQDALKTERNKYRSQFGDIGEDQMRWIANSDPYLAGLIQNAPEPLNLGNIGRYLAGDPDRAGNVDQYSLDAVRAAQELVANDLIDQGYDIQPEDFNNAIGNDMKAGESISTYMRRISGQGDPNAELDLWKNDIETNELAGQYDAQGRPLVDENGIPMNLSPDQREGALNDRARTWITQQGIPIPSGNQFGSEADLMGLIQSGGQEFLEAYQQLAANSGGIGFNTEDWRDQVKKLAPYNFSAQHINLLKSLLYQPSLDSGNRS
jgi:hypothetical protein